MEWSVFADDKREVVLASPAGLPLTVVIRKGVARVEVGAADDVRSRYTAVTPSKLEDAEYSAAEAKIDAAIRSLEDYFADDGA